MGKEINLINYKNRKKNTINNSNILRKGEYSKEIKETNKNSPKKFDNPGYLEIKVKTLNNRNKSISSELRESFGKEETYSTKKKLINNLKLKQSKKEKKSEKKRNVNKDKKQDLKNKIPEVNNNIILTKEKENKDININENYKRINNEDNNLKEEIGNCNKNWNEIKKKKRRRKKY